MAQFVTIILLSWLAVAQSDVSVMSKRLLEVQRMVFPERKTPIIFHHPNLLSSTESVLVHFLKESSDPMLIIGRAEIFEDVHRPTINSILFLDMMDADIKKVLATFNRRIIVTTRSTFKAIIDERKYLNGIFIVYDETECPIYHYNRYKKSLHKLDVLQNDPLLASTRDLAGMPFSTLEKHFIDYAFLELAAMRFNGSIELTRIASFYLVYLNYKYTVHYDYGYVPLYLHRNERVFVLVPRLNKPIPSIYVITDPLDISSWISLFSAVIGLSLIRTFISRMYTVRHILRNFVLVLECFTLGA